jgi:hypothetical protein
VTARGSGAAMGRRRRGVVNAVLCGVLAVALLYFAVPRTFAGWTLMNAELRLAELRRGHALKPAAINGTVEAYDQAAGWIDDGEVRLNLAYAQLVQRRIVAKSNEAQAKVFAPIEANLKAGLARSPVEADSWRWLAVIRLAINKDRKGALAATRLSAFTGPYVQYLIVPRIGLALQLWDIYPADEREFVYQQIRYAWNWLPATDILAMAAKAKVLWPFRIALAQNPRDLVSFEQKLRAYEALRKQPRPRAPAAAQPR